MKILSITTQKPDSTGSGVYLAEMVKAFHELGHTQAVIAGIAPSDNPSFPRDVRFEPVYYETDALPFPVLGMSDEMPYTSTRYCDMTPEMVDQLKAAFQGAVTAVIEEFEPDLIICHHLYLMSASIREVVVDIPLVAICHGTDIRQMRKHDLEKDYIAHMVQNLDACFALHDEQAAEIVETYGVEKSKVSVIGTGYDSKLFHDRGRLPASAPGKLRLLYVGKIWEKKGVKSLIRALEYLPYTRDNFELELIGGHSHIEELESIQALAKQSRYSVLFRGKYTPAQVAEAYRRNDVFVLPSFFEGLPLVVIEALACGCKVVITDLPGIRDWIESRIPKASITYVSPPLMKNTDEPLEECLPAFERELAEALVRIASEPLRSASIEDVSWTSLCKELLGKVY
ncbi:MAG: glycosyltransferase family 4 protein [Raoultibacter sp.]|jgi:glycosyltransferase involved in cell wall biosynthesis